MDRVAVVADRVCAAVDMYLKYDGLGVRNVVDVFIICK